MMSTDVFSWCCHLQAAFCSLSVSRLWSLVPPPPAHLARYTHHNSHSRRVGWVQSKDDAKIPGRGTAEKIRLLLAETGLVRRAASPDARTQSMFTDPHHAKPCTCHVVVIGPHRYSWQQEVRPLLTLSSPFKSLGCWSRLFLPFYVSCAEIYGRRP